MSETEQFFLLFFFENIFFPQNVLFMLTCNELFIVILELISSWT